MNTLDDLKGDRLAYTARVISSTQAPIVATGNPGCLLQLANGTRRQNRPIRVAHPVTLLAEAYREKP